MTTRGQINSNFYQIVDVDANANPTAIKNEFVANANVYHAMFANVANIANSVAGANVTGYVANATHATISDSANSVAGANVSGYVANATHATISDSANSVAGANVSGYVANATHANVSDSANSVAVANVSGIGNIATINLDGSSANILYGNGAWAPATGGGTYSNANVASFLPTYTGNISANVVSATLFSGSGANLTNITGANVTGIVGNATHANVADSANLVAVANVSGIGNIATINLTGSTTNVLYGNGVFAPIIQDDANYANYAGNVVIAAQPNVTSLGNLVSMTLNNTVTPITANVGQMFWDTGEHTVTLGMENGVQQQIGLESYIWVKANAAITDGQVVMFVGASGDNVLAAPANAAAVGFKPEYIVGIATQSIAHNDFGYVTVFGKVHGLNTNSYNVGDILWYDPTSTTGGLTNVQPTDPACQVQMAAVTKKSAGDGHIQVRVIALTALTNLTDVKITSPLNGQTITYDTANLVWVNSNVATTSPGGSNTQVQFNDNGTFGGNAGLTFNKVTNILTLTGGISIGGNLSVSGNANFTGTTTNLGSNANINISGGSSGQFLSTNGSGNLSWATASGSSSTDFTPSFLLGGM